MTNPLRIGVDLAGSDLSEATLGRQFLSEIKGALSLLPSLQLFLYCSDSILSKIISELGCESFCFAILSDDFVPMDAPPASVLRSKKTTLASLLNDLKSGVIDACVSCANTGALIVAASRILGRLPHLHHPALIVSIPSKKRDGAPLFLDAGATLEASERDLLTFAALGAIYSGRTNPKVALFNNGSEMKKGPKAIQRAYNSLQKHGGSFPFIFQGNVEPKDLFSENAPDVVVSSGFAGNIFLKTVEAVFEAAHVHEASFSKDARLYRTALIGGVRGVVCKCHGDATGHSLKDAIEYISQIVQRRHIIQSACSWFEKHGLWLRSLVTPSR